MAKQLKRLTGALMVAGFKTGCNHRLLNLFAHTSQRVHFHWGKVKDRYRSRE